MARRAEAVPAEYLGKARTLDRQWLHTSPGQQGPIEIKLRGYGTVKSLVFGSWGEASADVDWMLNSAVDIGAARGQRASVVQDANGDADALRAAVICRLRRR